MLLFLFFVVYFSLSQATTSGPVTTLSSAVTTNMTYNGSKLHGADSSFRSAKCGSATTTEPMGHSEMCCWPHRCSTAAISVSHAFSGLCHYSHRSSSGELFIRVEPPTKLFTLLSVMLSAFYFRFQCDCQVYQWAWTIGVCIMQCYGAWQTYLPDGAILWPMQNCTRWLLHLLLQVRGSFMLCSQLSLSHSSNIVVQTTWGVWQSHPIPLPSLYGRKHCTQCHHKLQICIWH